MLKKSNALLAVFVAAWLFSMRMAYIFINSMAFNGLAEIVLALMIINAIIALLIVLYNKSGKLLKISLTFTIISLIIDIIILSIALSDWQYFATRFIEIVPYLAIGIAFVYLIFIFPKTGYYKEKFIGIILTAAMILMMVSTVYTFTPFSFRSRPVVFEAGEQYAIVWTTTAKATAYLKYIDKDTNLEVTIYEEESGNIIADKTIHRIYVDKDQLDNNTYEVFSQKTIMHLPNNAVMGKIIESGDINFIGYHNQEDISLLTIADVHDFTKPALEAASYIDNYDVLVLLGDLTSEIADEDQLINGTLKLAADISGGAKPVLYLRGNHETRGAYCNFLKDYIGLPDNDYNYTYRYGSLAAVILDTGEDKDDDHIEYSGLARYSEYRQEQTKWLEGVEASGFFNAPDIEYKAVIGHIPLDPEENGDYWNEWLPILNRLVSVQLAGHMHSSEIFPLNAEHEFPIIIGGGRKGSLGQYFTASNIVFSNGKIYDTSYNQDGEVVFDGMVG